MTTSSTIRSARLLPIKWKEAQEKNESFIDATLSVNVLYPAMGSGHFLVGTVEFLSQKLLEAVTLEGRSGKDPHPTQYTDGWARREAVSHCIYGVDLNDLAGELAQKLDSGSRQSVGTNHSCP